MLRAYEKKALIVAAVLIPPLLILYLIHCYGSRVPYWDQWELVPLLEKLYHHNLHISDLLAQHSEHRILFPRMIMLALAYLTGWNIYYELYTNFILACLILLVLYSLLKRTFPNRTRVWLLIVFSFIVFSPVQWENWTWGWQIQLFLAALGTVAAVWSVSEWPGQWKGLVIAIAAAVVASYSFSNGLLTWVVVLPLLLQKKTRRWSQIVLWTVVFIATVCLYYYKYTKPSYHPALTVCLHRPFEFAGYVLVYIGSPLAFGNGIVSVVAGGIFLIMGAALVVHIAYMRRKDFALLLPWLSLAAYVFLSACATGVGRLGFGIGQARSSRYTTFANLLIVSLLVVLSHWTRTYAESHRRFPKSLTVLRYLLFLLFIWAYTLGFTYGRERMQSRFELLTTSWPALEDFKRAPDAYLLRLYPRADIIRERAQILSDLGIILPKSPAEK